MSNEIDDKYIDVDFTIDPHYVFGDRGAPCFGDYGPSYEEKFGVMSDKELREAIEKQDANGGALDLMVNWVLNQGKEGSCVANADVQGHHVKQALQYGKDNVIQLSAISLYKQIGRSASSGASVRDGIETMCELGALPLNTDKNKTLFHHTMPATGFSTQYPNGWKETAKLFKGREYDVIKSVAGIHSALCSGHPVMVGREGHSILYLRSMVKNGALIVKYVNSWGSWGDKGFGYDTVSQITKSANWAVAIRSVIMPDLTKLKAGDTSALYVPGAKT